MRVTRAVLGVGGLALLAEGGWLLFRDTPAGTPGEVATWLAGTVAVHDLVLVPLVLALGLALRGLRSGRVRGAVRGALLVAGCVTLVALPPLLRPGRPRNPTALPLDYVRNLALVLLAVALTTAAFTMARAVLARRRG